MCQVGDVCAATHVGFHALNCDDAYGALMVIWQATCSYLAHHKACIPELRLKMATLCNSEV